RADVNEADVPAVALLPEEAVLRPLGTAVLNEIDVEQTVAIEVEQGGAGAQGLRHEITADRPGIVNKIEAPGVGDVGEPGRSERRVVRDRRRGRPRTTLPNQKAGRDRHE